MNDYFKIYISTALYNLEKGFLHRSYYNDFIIMGFLETLYIKHHNITKDNVKIVRDL